MSPLPAPWQSLMWIQPDEMVTKYGDVAGPIDPDPSWKLEHGSDLLPGTAIKALGGSGTWTISGGPTGDVGCIVLVNSNIDPGVVMDVSAGGFSGTITMGAWAGKVPYNPCVMFAEQAGVSSVTLSVPGNSQTVIFGDIIAGKLRELERPIIPKGRRGWQRYNVEPAPHLPSVKTYPKGLAGRTFTGTTSCTQTGLDAIQAWYDSCDDNALPSIIIPEPGRRPNDAWCVKWNGEFAWEKEAPFTFHVTLSFIEIARIKWNAA